MPNDLDRPTRNLAGTTTALLLLMASVTALAHFRSDAVEPRGQDRRRGRAGAARPGTDGPIEAVAATVETTPVPRRGDAADDPAIWVNRRDPSRSTIIGTDKTGGLAVYDLAGRQIQYLPDGRLNNVDLRHGFRLGGREIALVTAGNRTDDSIAVYRVNPETRRLEDVAARRVITTTVYGSCMYRSSKTGRFYYIVTSKQGIVEQWELVDNGNGKVDAREKVRTLSLGSQTEGCVADDELGHLYVGEEEVGIWKYGAEPEAGDRPTLVDRTRRGGYLAADVEGLTIVYGRDGTGFLIASSQGSDTFTVYRREGSNAFVKSFRIVDGNGVDGAEETDGIDAATGNLGPTFPHGVFVAQDGSNDNGNQNFKLVPLQLIIGKD
jgi:3-phytase